jgi:LuxR family maltose regulon positive regulatory protein
VTEVRSVDLRFTLEEAHAFLCGTTGRELDPEWTRLWANKTEGWVVGLRLAALSMRDRPQDKAFVREFQGAGIDLIVEYFTSEVLAQQSAEVLDFVLRTSILDRFCAPLCAALTELSAARCQEIIDHIAQSNLFFVSLDEEGGWYRYHHLFQDLMRHRLRQLFEATDISELQARAGAWFAEQGWTDEALHHLLAAGDTATAVALVAQRRYALMNGAQWARLEQYLHAFSPDRVEQSPELLMVKTWLLYQRGRYVELPAAVQCIETALARTSLAPEAVDCLWGEISALHALASYWALDAKGTAAHAQRALSKIPNELWSMRLLARVYLAGARLMMGDESGAHSSVYAGFER